MAALLLIIAGAGIIEKSFSFVYDYCMLFNKKECVYFTHQTLIKIVLQACSCN